VEEDPPRKIQRGHGKLVLLRYPRKGESSRAVLFFERRDLESSTGPEFDSASYHRRQPGEGVKRDIFRSLNYFTKREELLAEEFEGQLSASAFV